jgi:hypothetical protein
LTLNFKLYRVSVIDIFLYQSFSAMVQLNPLKRVPHIYEPTLYRDTKDPTVLLDPNTNIWHLYGSGGQSTSEEWKILHAVSVNGQDDWKELEPVTLIGLAATPHTCAPGMYADKDGFHMFVQTEFMGPKGNIYYLNSKDGSNFYFQSLAIPAMPGTIEESMYDSHPAILKNKKGEDEYFITYSAGPNSGYGNAVHGDICLAKSKTNSWNGPWERLGSILSHEKVNHHNQHNHPDYEWGLEGAQLIQLDDGKILLNAVCFLPDGARGTRQRVFFAFADNVKGPYISIGPVLKPIEDEWQSGENGHASGFVRDSKLYLYYQSRPVSTDSKWRYGVAEFDPAELARTYLPVVQL